MILLGITGGIGMGKSTSARILQDVGIAVTDTDVIAREVVAPGAPALDEVRAAFGPEVFLPEGALDRARLAGLVFADATARRRLEAILHPRIRAEWERQVAAWRAGNRAAGAVVIPLLFETGAETAFDATVCVACSPATQADRLRQRGWSDDHRRQRVAAQWPLEQKIERSTFVLWTDVPEVEHARQWRVVLHSLGLSTPGGG